jgi:transglutaminase-like putative cysteine protease
VNEPVGVLERIRRVNAPPPPEESVALRGAVLAAVLVAAGAVLAEDVGGPVLRVAVFLGIPAGFVWSHVAREREGFWLKLGLALGVLVVFGGFLRAVSGAAGGSFAEVQVPLAELFLWVQLLHSLDVPGRRDLLFSLVSSLVLIAVAGVLSISLGFGLYLLAWGIAALAALVLAHRSEIADLPRLGTSPGPGRTTGVASSLRPLFVVVALVAVLGVTAFLVSPAAGGARSLTFPASLPSVRPTGSGGGIANPSLGAADPAAPDGSGGAGASFGYFGFSNGLDTAVRGRPDDTVVMRVRSSAPDFWRGQSFDQWDGRRWTASDEAPEPVVGASPFPLPASRPGGEELVQTYYVEKEGPNLVFGAMDPVEVHLAESGVFVLSDGTIRTAAQLPGGTVYTVVSRRVPATPALLRQASGPDAPRTPAAVAARYLQLPDVPERVRTLAREVTAGAPTTYDKVRALEAWMGGNTRYTLDIPPLPKGQDAVERFLFVDRQGFCEQIGTALVVMLRSLGVPARLGVGYAAGERNPFTGLYEVRASDAHAWAEVWFPGVGWQIFDPTASVPLAGESALAGAGAGLSAFLSARLPDLPDAVPLLLALAALAGAGAGLRSLLRRRRRRRVASARSWAEAWSVELESLGATVGRPRRPHESVREYVTALRPVLPARGWSQAVAVVEEDAFSGTPASPDRRATAEQVLVEARRSDG